MKLFNNWKFIVLLCLTIGLAPLTPEPHIWGKLKWIFGGAKSMQIMDWIDVFLHGFPFVLLIWILISKIKQHGA